MGTEIIMIKYHLIEIYVFFLGMCVGSFMNVCIYRLPNAKSIVRPRSMCPKCGNPIRFYDNIPLFSYLWLRGRCRHCNTSISFRYPMVEVMAGFFALIVYLWFGITLKAFVYYAFIATLLVITFIDIDHYIIPDVITLPGIPICFLASFALPTVTYKDALLGILAGGGSLFAVAWIYHLLTGKEGMGGGDIKLLSMIGALLGWKGVFFTIFVSSAFGTLIGSAVMLYTRKDRKLAVPFGPFLAMGAIVYVFFGSEILYWYINFIRS